jgi:hypothetical protein
MYAIRPIPLEAVPNVPKHVRVAVNDWFTMPFSYGMMNRHARTVNWLALSGLEHGIVSWKLFKNSGDHLGAAIANEYNVACALPGYEISFQIPNKASRLNTTHKLVMVPRCINGDRAIEEPFLLLLDVNIANATRPHMPISFSDFSPAMPYWGIFHTISSDEQRIQRISAKRHNDRLIMVWQLMRQKRLPFQLFATICVG